MEDVNAEESNRNLKRHQYLPAQFVCRAPTLRAVAMSDAGVRMLMECRREHGPTRVSSTENGQAAPASPGTWKSEVPAFACAPTVGP
ncbi:hypothetical protein BHE90_016632 [Fusarium euwallaceae]|uniref:Uncharacterized protein n=2 Tax=Fusarium solani species complex TaxID=232080 RepID=A0A430KZT7_9HYPO|nr:hypothetical protein CEP51_002946 [Fusarium floridanum]RTE68988.1 hypothetical protein BHE90_016632 [Fusarium euwallaceae]